MKIRKGSRARELTIELVVGTFVFAVLLALALFTIVLRRENLFAENFYYRIVFQDVMGLRAGDDVTIKGLSVGKIKELSLHEDGVHVVCSVRTKLRLKQDCTFVIVPSSVLGGKYLQIDPGSPTARELPPQDLYQGQTPSDAFKEAAALIRSIRTAFESDLLGDASAIVRTLRSTLEEGKVADNLQGVFADARETAAQLKEVSSKINSGQGTIGRLITDDELYVELKAALSEGRAMLGDLRETAPVVSFSSILFGAL